MTDRASKSKEIKDDVSKSKDETKTFAELLDELCGFYISIGMTYNEFWHGDIRALSAYRDAWERKREAKNQELWLQGLYNYRAYKAVMEAFSHGLAGGKGKRPEGYIDKPVPVTERERAAELKRRQEYTLRWVERGQNS